MTPVEPPPASTELPPNTNVVMPTVVARRPIMRQNSPPPPPPPKDDLRDSSRTRSILDRKRSKELLLGRDRKPSPGPVHELLSRDRDRERDQKTPSPVSSVRAAPPTSKFSAPTSAPTVGELNLGKMSFDLGGVSEKQGDMEQRPPMETFVTADEDELTRSQRRHSGKHTAGGCA
jgi:hypothetical protein